jgi:WD40 repeat protein
MFGFFFFFFFIGFSTIAVLANRQSLSKSASGCNQIPSKIFTFDLAKCTPHLYFCPSIGTSGVLGSQAIRPILPADIRLCWANWDRWSSLLKVFSGHTESVESVAFSSDGKQIVSGSVDHTVRIWDSETGDVIVCNRHNFVVNAVAFSPKGRHIISGGFDGLRLWDSKNGALISTLARENWIFCVAFSPDGNQVASGSHSYEVQLWDLKTGAVVKEFKGHTRFVRSVAFSPDGKHIASGSEDHTIRVWDTESRTLLAGPFKGHTDQIMSVAFAPSLS